jgi:hypothetical protein
LTVKRKVLYQDAFLLFKDSHIDTITLSLKKEQGAGKIFCRSTKEISSKAAQLRILRTRLRGMRKSMNAVARAESVRVRGGLREAYKQKQEASLEASCFGTPSRRL